MRMPDRKANTDRGWDLLIALRIYAIVTFILMPVIHVSIVLHHVQPVGYIVIGLALWLIARFVLFETRTSSRRFLIASLAFLLPASALIFLNFLAGAIINFHHNKGAGFTFDLAVVIVTTCYFPAMIILRPLQGLNARRPPKSALKIALLAWAVVSAGLLVLPYRVSAPAADTVSKPGRLGFWTNGQFFDPKTAGPGRYVSDEMLEKFGERGVYLVYSGVTSERIRTSLVRDMTRCRDHGVKVSVSVAPTFDGYTFVNIWTFEELMGRVEQALAFLKANGLIGNPVTALVYDMEAPTGRFFPLYGRDPATVGKLRDYYRIERLFVDFNRRLRREYGIDIRICAETNQAFDPRDGDDDLIALYGVLSDPEASMSYMIYRRAGFRENYVLDSARYLHPSDTIILSAWEFKGYQCWGDVECAVRDARLVLAYPQKHYNVEVWALCYFLDSYGQQGLFKFVDQTTSDPSSWPGSEIRNSWPHSCLWDLAITAISTLDLYGPLFRVVLRV